MSEDSQIVIPPSFVQLFIEPHRSRPSLSREEIQARYGYCEDLANMLVETAKARLWQLGLNESDVLSRIEAGLNEDGVVASTQEAWWVARRLAELLEDWSC
jgi:hypothetical protein